jgi:ABC-2 type transport system permease protein
MNRRVLSLIRKEFIHILRDWRSLLIIFLLPILMILVYGYAITFDIKEIKLGILDQDSTPASHELINELTSSQYFRITCSLQSRAEIESVFLQRSALAVLIIPAGFARDRVAHATTAVQLVVDGANANTATIAANYFKVFLAARSPEARQSLLRMPAEIKTHICYNPSLKSTDFIVPGLTVVIMMMICSLLTSISIARERETGTMEQILVSSVRPIEIILGKITPYLLLALLDAASIIVFSTLVFKLPFRGSPALLLVLSVFFVYAALSIGVLISTQARTQQSAMIAANVTFELPSLLLSGFIYPLSSLPQFLQFISDFIPTKHFIIINRGIMLKGIGFSAVYPQTLFLFLFGTVLLTISLFLFKTKLEG